MIIFTCGSTVGCVLHDAFFASLYILSHVMYWQLNNEIGGIDMYCILF